jgi:hypothetical protein
MACRYLFSGSVLKTMMLILENNFDYSHNLNFKFEFIISSLIEFLMNIKVNIVTLDIT